MFSIDIVFLCVFVSIYLFSIQTTMLVTFDRTVSFFFLFLFSLVTVFLSQIYAFVLGVVVFSP